MLLDADDGPPIIGLQCGIQDLGIDLGGAELGMAEEILDAGDIHASIEQAGGQTPKAWRRRWGVTSYGRIQHPASTIA